MYPAHVHLLVSNIYFWLLRSQQQDSDNAGFCLVINTKTKDGYLETTDGHLETIDGDLETNKSTKTILTL